MAQFLRPDSNVTQTNWTGGFADIDEATASDADFSYGANNSASATLEVGLTNPSIPAGGTCTVRWRHGKVDAGTLSGTGGTVQQTCGLYQGGTLISSSTVTVGGTWTQSTFTFQVTAITDWNNLRLRWTQTNSGGGVNARGSAVSWAEVETPDAAQAVTVAGGAGSFTITGVDAATTYARRPTGEAGAFTLTGVVAGTLYGRQLPADVGAFAETGNDASLFVGFPLWADAGAFTLTGQDAGSTRNYSLAADAAAVAATPQDAILRASLSSGLSDPGVFTVNGQDATLLKGIPVVGGVGQFIADFNPAGLPRTYVLAADVGAIDATGINAGLVRPVRMPVDTVQFIITGQAAGSQRSIRAAAWTANTSYPAGFLVRATVLPGTGLVFKALNSGSTSGTQPTWPTMVGNTVVDGGITWVAVSLISGEFQSAAPSAIIELFELQLVQALHGSNDIYRFHAGANATANNSDIVWAGNSYMRFPIEAEGFEYSGNGQLPRPKIRVSNIFSTISAILSSVNQITPGSDLTGAKVTRIRTLARYLDNVNFEGGSNPFGQPDSNAEFPREIYYIDRKSAENRAVVEFELASALDLAGVRGPKRQCIANVCQWRYRSAECSYTGGSYFDENDQPAGSLALDVCGKRLSSCEKRFGVNAELPFGSFPGVGAYTT